MARKSRGASRGGLFVQTAPAHRGRGGGSKSSRSRSTRSRTSRSSRSHG